MALRRVLIDQYQQPYWAPGPFHAIGWYPWSYDQTVVPTLWGGNPASRSGLMEVAVAAGLSRTPCQMLLSFVAHAFAAMQLVTWSPAFSQML
jgi:hypothetical protein